MPVDYDKIREENIRYYGEGDRHLYFLQELYDRRTHFVFELLQNADDARATKIEFVIHPDRLDVVHDGRIFDENDVRSICGIAESNKADEDEKIGRFGIGFKSVYSYTTAPAVHSGDEHFRIEKYVRPIATRERSMRSEFTTLFELPFDKDTVTAEDASAELRAFFEDRTQFPSTVLLFLRHVQEVKWRILGGSEGRIIANSAANGSDAQDVLLERVDRQGTDLEAWLVLSRDLSALDFPKLRVQAAFLLGSHEGQNMALRLERSPLAVFFPTAVETHLGFLIQGPYQTTPARDNLVRDSAINIGIHHEVAELVVQSAIGLRDRGLLDTETLECFPLRWTDFPPGSPFEVLRSRFRDAVIDEPLIPTHGGGFGRGGELRVSPSAMLPDLFDGDRLATLLGDTEHAGAKWVSTEVTVRKRPDLFKFLTEAPVDRYDDPPLAPELRTIGIVRQLDAEFLEAQSVDWTLKLYEFLDTQNEREVVRALELREWIRCEDGKCRAAEVDDEPAVWLPSSGSGDETYPIVARELARDATVRRLLARYGVAQRDEVDEILDHVLAYYHDEELRTQISPTENFEHIRRFLDAVEEGGARASLLAQRIGDARVLLARNAATGEADFQFPGDVYYCSEDLEAWFEGAPTGWFVHEQYESLRERLSVLGVRTELLIRRRRPDSHGYVVTRKYRGDHARGVGGFDPDCAVDGMKHAFENPTTVRARFVWNVLLPQLSRSIKGYVQSSTRETFQGASTEERYSPFGQLVSGTSWLPNRAGEFLRPDELQADDLPEDFVWHEQSAHAIGMRGSTVSQVAEALGEDPEFVLFMKSEAARELYKEWQKKQAQEKTRDARDEATPSAQAAQHLDFEAELTKTLTREGRGEAYKPETHLDPMPNPERRQAAAAKDISDARQREPAAVERFRRVPVRVWEDKSNETRTFIEQEYIGECQICQQWFMKRSGRVYFEAHYLVSNKQAAWIDRPGNVLCLCAQCGAKFEHGEVDTGDFVQQVAEWRPNTTDGKIEFPIRLCGDDKMLRYSARHLLDLQALLRAGSEAVVGVADEA